MIRSKLFKSIFVGACALVLAGAALGQVQEFNVPEGDLKTALDAYARQSGLQLIYRVEDVRNIESRGVQGPLPAQDALDRLLEGTGFTVQQDASGAIAIVRAGSASKQTSADGAERSVRDLGEVMVTGSRIRGALPTAPLRMITRDEIEQSGYGHVGDLIRSLPENFGGGENPGHVGTGAVDQNVANSSTVNLRGLGDGATLVLLNGRRMAGNVWGQSADISGIPLAAIERIDVVTDGSSAIYGSDAVAGVVNFILRKDYDGAEVSVRYGGATQGGGEEWVYTALAGTAKSNWHAMVNVEYSKQGEIKASDREVTSGAPPALTLMRPQERASVFFNVGRNLTDRIALELDGLWSNRHTRNLFQQSRQGVAYPQHIDTPAYSLSGSLTAQLASDWSFGLSAGTSHSETEYLNIGISRSYFENDVHFGEVAFEGTAAELQTGDLRLALGAGRRKESFYGGSGLGQGSHGVNYLLGEAFVPLVLPSEDRMGLQALEFSVSARYEDYSEYGSVSTPKVGLRYVPLPGLTLRGTWGESFKTPTFRQYSQQSTISIENASNVGYTGAGTAFYVTGGSEDLLPERSRSWTFGMEYSPDSANPPTLAATYFNIDYTDRVVLPINAATTSLSNPAYAPFVIWNPSASEQAALIAAADWVFDSSGSEYDPANVVAVILNRFANAISQEAKGVDLSYRQAFLTSRGSVNVFGNATWTRLEQQTLPTLPQTAVSGTIFNVPEFRGRAGVTWESGGLSATGVVNHQSGNTDTGMNPSSGIASWTTFDAYLAWRFAASTGALAGASLSLSVSNLFDRDPPFAASPGILQEGLYFDSVNSSVIGRFVGLTVRKQF